MKVSGGTLLVGFPFKKIHAPLPGRTRTKYELVKLSLYFNNEKYSVQFFNRLMSYTCNNTYYIII